METLRDQIERVRLEVLRSCDILDTAPEPLFDEAVRLVADACTAPIACFSLVDAQRQWFKARIGVDVSESTRDISFCTHTIESDQVLVVPDAVRDPRFATNPLVVGPPWLRFYAGCPVTVANAHVGTLCVLDYRLRHLRPQQLEVLTRTARLCAAWLSARRRRPSRS